MPFVKKQKNADPTTLVVLDPPKAPTVKTCRSACGEARKRIEELEVQRETACRELTHTSRTTVADATLDVVAVASVMNQAQEKLDAIDRALVVARQRAEHAELALKDADERVQRDELRKKLTQLGDTARVVDAWLDSGKPIIEAYHAARKDVLDFGYRDIATVINVANLSFQTYLFRTCAPMANCNTGYSAFQTDPRWAAPWSMMNPQPNLADSVQLT